MKGIRSYSLVPACLAFVLTVAAAAPAPDVPRRVASLNLSADEVLVEILPPERLVTVTTFVDDPSLSNVVGRAPKGAVRFTRAKMDRLLELGPDLVVVSKYTDADFLHLLSTSGLRYHKLEGVDSLTGIPEGLLALGRAVGEEAKARVLVDQLQATLRDLESRLKGVRRPRVLHWSEPSAAGPGTLVHSMIEAAGGADVGAEMGVTGFMPVGAERALLADPDVFFVPATGEAALRAHPVLSRSRAVRDGRIVTLPGPLLSTLTHHAARACWHLAHGLHPERVPKDPPR